MYYQTLYYLGREILFGGFLFIFFYILNKEQAPLLTYFFLTILSVSLFVFLLSKYGNKGKSLFLIVIVPILSGGAWISSIPIPILFLLSVLIFMRTISHFNTNHIHNEGNWVLSSFIVGTIVYLISLNSESSDSNYVLFLLIIQLLYCLAGGFIIRYLSMTTNVEEKSSYARPFLTVMGAIIFCGMLLTSSLSLIKFLLFSSLKGLAWIVGLLAFPLFNWAEKFEAEKAQDNLPKIEEKNEELEQLIRESQATESMFDPFLFLAIGVGIAFVLFSIYIFKKKKVNLEKNVDEKNKPFSIVDSKSDKEYLRTSLRKNVVPSSLIRKEIYELEKYANQLQVGRRDYESLLDWLERLDVKNYKFINQVYEQTRYGKLLTDVKIEERFHNEIKQTKLQLKELHKEMIESGEIKRKRFSW
ncbi:hypothetical protein SM124_02290 [Bacillus sp. 31A1R]|uniref:DUF4129 domain-containing protein n=1 Tax=Robertmurraya mangrovi TaxID=3098077 RepID=A0ABU5ITT2_9BACI|nr:hypothetical protein [Bacillus sp. 31A1R]MDZ5470570.1 hypothetical protein [Bacillus sp. 31A1R]